MQLHTAGWHVKIIFIHFQQTLWKVDKKRIITCSYIWYIDKAVCVYWLHTQSVEVWRHKNSDMNGQNNAWKNSKNAIESENLP